MLHFRNPSLYAIWDSRVVLGLLRTDGSPAAQKPHHQLMQRVDLFTAYQERLRTLTEDTRVQSMQVPGLGKATAMRRAEYCLFWRGGEGIG